MALSDIIQEKYADLIITPKRKQIIKKHEYKKNEQVQKLIEKAQSGDDRSFFKLITIDKSFLFEPWAKLKFAFAYIDDNSLFFENLSDAIRKKSKKSPNEEKLKFLKNILEENDGKIAGLIQNQKICKTFLNILFQVEGPKGKEHIIPESFSDHDYFRKWLKRNGYLK
jgi:hypothetical protein